jgi:hypothetical protein
MDATAKNMTVAVRVRPLSSKELKAGCTQCCSLLSEKTVVIAKEQQAKYLRSQKGSVNEYAFDHTFDETSSQQSVYDATTKPFMAKLVAGFNVTVFAYGATGSGKTHTMMGNTRYDESAAVTTEAGIIPNALQDVFQLIETEKQKNEIGTKWSVGVTFIEVYNEQVYDLLQPMGKCLPLREDKVRGVVEIAGVAEKSVAAPSEVLDLLQQGNKYRKTEATMANQVSSRSHAVLQLMVRRARSTPGGRESVTESKLSLIDLAGSERASATQNRGARLTEGANINKSLLALANCINALSEKGKKSISVKFRDSKLTHLLRSSLEGNCSLIMIANINPSDKTFEDSHNTLKYANRAKNIKVDPTVNDRVVESNWMERETRLREENILLRNQVSELQKKMELYLTHQGSMSQMDLQLLGTTMAQLASQDQESPKALPAVASAHAPAPAPAPAEPPARAPAAVAWKDVKIAAPLPAKESRFIRKGHVLRSSEAAVVADPDDGSMHIDLRQEEKTPTPKSARKRSKRVPTEAAEGDKSIFTLGSAFTISDEHDEQHELMDTTAVGRDALLPKYSIRIAPEDPRPASSPPRPTASTNQEEHNPNVRRSARKKRPHHGGHGHHQEQHADTPGSEQLPKYSVRIAPEQCNSPVAEERERDPGNMGIRRSARKRARAEQEVDESGLSEIMMPYTGATGATEMSSDEMPVASFLADPAGDDGALRTYKKRRGSGIPLRVSNSVNSSSASVLPSSTKKVAVVEDGPETEMLGDGESFCLAELVPLHAAKGSKPTLLGAATAYYNRGSSKAVNNENIQKGNKSLFKKSDDASKKGRVPFGTYLNNKIQNVKGRNAEVAPL